MTSNGVKVALTPLSGVRGRRPLKTHTQRQREDDHVKIEAEVEVMVPQLRNSKDCWEPRS